MEHYGDITKISECNSTYCVYKYVFPNGMIYVGMTKNTIQKRRDNGYQHNIRLRNAVKMFGWKNVQTTILASGLSKEKACKKEIEFIRELNANDPNVGYNISMGGTSTYAGLKHTKEYKRHMSDLHKGRVFSKETLMRMKDAHKAERIPVIMCSLSGKELTRYESLRSAASDVDGYASNISRSCKSGRAYKGYLWKKEGVI